MPKHIDVEKALEVINHYGKAAIDDGRHELDPVDDIILLSGAVSVIPAADVTEVRHGSWVRQKGRPEAICSECGREVVYQTIDNRWHFEEYCPHCGTKMGDSE